MQFSTALNPKGPLSQQSPALHNRVFRKVCWTFPRWNRGCPSSTHTRFSMVVAAHASECVPLYFLLELPVKSYIRTPLCSSLLGAQTRAGTVSLLNALRAQSQLQPQQRAEESCKPVMLHDCYFERRNYVNQFPSALVLWSEI